MLITLDMVRADHLGVYGYERDTTPSLDALAREAAVFEHAYTSSTLSAPAHASLLTGLEPEAHGLVDNVHRLSDEALTLAERMREAGYRTAGFITYPLVGEDTGLSQGFQTFELHKLPNHPHERAPSLEESQRVFERAAAWLREHDNRFFLWVHVQHAHFDFRPAAELERRFLEEGGGEDERFDCIREISDAVRAGTPIPDEAVRQNVARYDAEIAAADQGIGLVLEALRDIGAWERTSVVVAADHGVLLFDRVPQGFSVDHVDEFFEEVVRVPLLLRVPGRGGARIGGHVSLTSVAETLAELARLPPAPGARAPSLLPAVERGHGAREVAPRRWIYGPSQRAIRVGDEKLIVRGEKTYLYDLAADPGERTNLATARPDRVHALLPALFRRDPDEGLKAEPLAPSAEVLEALREGGYLDQLGRSD